LSAPQAVGSLFTVNRVVGHYQKGSFSAEGQVGITLPGLKPFVANLEYLGELNGYAMTTSKVQFNLPDLGGAKTTGYLNNIEYTSKLGGFQGEGFFEANLPVLGKTQAHVTMNRNKLNEASVTFLKAAFPASSPIITGAGDGKIDFDDYNRFKEAYISGKFYIALHNDDKEIKPALLEGGAFIKGGKYGMGLELKSDLVVNQYLTLHHFKIERGPEGEVLANGSFGVNGLEDAPDIPIESKGKELAPVAGYLPSIRSDQIDASVKYGYDWVRGFWLDGTVNYPISKEQDEGILSGRLTYSNGKLGGSVEAGDLQLIPLSNFSKKLYSYHNTFALSPWGKIGGLSKLGGIFGEVDAQLEFRYTLGPVTVDAHANLVNIRLGGKSGMIPGADLDPLMIEEVRGGAQAALQGTPYLGLAAWFASEDFATVRGGLAFPVTANMGTEATIKNVGLSYVNGKFEGSDISVNLPLAFGLNGAIIPNVEVWALRGLIDKQLYFKELAKAELMEPRLLFSTDPSATNLNALRKTYTNVLPPFLPPNLEAAPKTTQDLVMKGSATDIPHMRPVNPKSKIKSDPGSYTAMPDAPMDLKKLVGNMVGDDKLKMVTDVINALEALAEKFGLGEKLDAVTQWLDDWGLLEPLMKGAEALEKLVNLVESGVDLTLSVLWDLYGVEIKKGAGDKDKNAPKSNKFEDVVESGMRPQRVIFAMGPTRVWVMTPIAQGKQTALEIEKNRLKNSGLEYSKMPELTFDNKGKVVSGTFFATIKIGEFGTLTNVAMPVREGGDAPEVEIPKSSKEEGPTPQAPDARTPTILQEFADADFTPTENLPGVKAEKMTGTFRNTQTKLTKVDLNKHAQVTMPNPLPMGGMELQSEQPALLAFEELNKEWVLKGRGLSFGDGSYITARLLEYSKNDKGFTGKGEVLAKWVGWGNARAQFAAADGKFTKFELIVNSELLEYPEGSPILFGQLAGKISINAKEIEKATVGGTLRLQHKAINQGKPVDVQANLDFNSELQPELLSTKVAKPVELVKGLANLQKLEAKYSFKTKKADLEADGDFALMGSKVGVGATYRDSTFSARLESDTMSAGFVAFKHIAIAHHDERGWGVGARAEVTGIKGFEHIGADVYYKTGKLGFIMGDKTTMPKDAVTPEGQTASPATVKTAKMPGMKLHAIFAFLEYDLGKKDFNGRGEIGLTIPVAEGNTLTGGGTFAIQKNAITDFNALIMADLNLPPSAPIVSGPVKGNVVYIDGKLSGDIKGDLQIYNSGQMKAKSVGKEKGVSEKTKTGAKQDGDSNVKFALSINPDSGLTGHLKQTGASSFGGFLTISGLNIQIASSIDVEKTVKGVESLGGSPQGLKEISAKIAKSGIARKSSMKGSGELKAGGKDSFIRGGMKLNYGEGGFKESTAELEFGTVPDKNAKTGVFGKVTGVYSPTAGFALTEGSLTAQLTKGLQAKGTIGRQNEKDLNSGLNADLTVDAKLMDGDNMYTKSLFKAKPRLFVPVVPLLFSLFGEAGVELKLKYGVTPFLLTGQANVSGINIKDGTFEKAFVNIRKEPSNPKNPTGDANVEFLGEPFVGLGAALVMPGVASVSGGMKFPISAKASVDPVLNTTVVYDKDGNLKGNFKLGFPLMLGVKVGALPYVEGEALAGLIKLTYAPSEPLGEVDLMAPKQVSTINIDLGNLDDDKKGAKDVAPSNVSELKSASPGEAAAQKVETPTRMVDIKKEVPPKVGKMSGSKKDDGSAPIGFGSVMDMFKSGFAKVINSAVEVYEKVKKIAGKLTELVSKGAESLGVAAKSVLKSVEDIGSWIMSYFGGDPDRALDEVQQSEDISDVDYVEEIPIFKRGNWGAYGDHLFGDEMYRHKLQMRDSERLMRNFQRIDPNLGKRWQFGGYPMSQPFMPRMQKVQYPLVKPMGFNKYLTE